MNSSRLSKIITPFLVLFACFSIGYGSWDIHAEKSYAVGEKGADPIAYFEKTVNKKTVKHYFTTIEAACETAGKDASNNTIYVIPRTNPQIENDCTLYSGDTLRFILDESTRDKDTNDVETDGFADTSPETYRKNQIILRKKLTIQSGATLVISGETGGAGPQGATSGNYCELMLDGGSIECNGTINCYGYIKDMSETKNNSEPATITVNNGGKIYEPLAIYDWGSAKYAQAKNDANLFPFSIYDLPNIRPKIKLFFGSILGCFVHVYGSNFLVGHLRPSDNKPVVIVGDADSGGPAFIKLRKNASLTWNFDSADKSITSVNALDHTIYIDISGNFDLGYIKTSIKKMTVNVSVDSSNYYLPISHIYKLSHDNGTAVLGYKTKFMPGSSLTIGQNSTVDMNANVLFYDTNRIGNDTIYGYSVSNPATLINDGILNINNGFGGFVSTSAQTGTINVSNNYSPVSDSYEAYKFNKKWTGFLDALKIGPFASGGGTIKYGSATNTVSIEKGKTYKSQTFYWIAG